MEEQREDQQQPYSGKRPEMLTFLCVLTFIGSGMATFSNFVFSVNYSFIQEMAASGELTFPGLDVYLNLPLSFFILSALFYAGSLLGAIQMWKLRKAGFHIYTVSQILLLLIPLIFPQFESFPFFNLIISATFVGLYSMNLKYMH